MTNWLILTDYAAKYRVSVSTLRRKIKNSEVRFRFEHGKYFVPDVPLEQLNEENSPPAPSPAAARVAPELGIEIKNSDEPVLNSATKVLNEIKKAYAQVLSEKESQIISLREEVSDLKTLIKVLESENTRLSQLLGREPNAPLEMDN